MKVVVILCILFIVILNPIISISISSLRKTFYKQHNCYRKNNRVPPLKISKKYELMAQRYANKLARENVGLHHSESNGKYGENIFWWSIKSGASKAVKNWYNEIKLHNYHKNYLDYRTGHFTQIVWKSTKYVGCGIAVARDKGVFVVCNYYPIGNYRGKFLKNVLRHKTLNPKC